MRKTTVEEDRIARIKLHGNLFADVDLAILKNVSLDRIIMVRQVCFVSSRDNVKAAVPDGCRIDSKPEVHGVRFQFGPERSVLVEGGFDTVVGRLHEDRIAEHTHAGSVER